jgi:REP element-mobilizing transposase RayT
MRIDGFCETTNLSRQTADRSMTNYRRNFVPGGSYFFTVNLADRRLRLLTEHIELLRTAFNYTRVRHPFAIEATVVLPDHLHAIWTLPSGGRLFVALAVDKIGVLTWAATRRMALENSLRQRRTRHLAKTLPGAHTARRR